MIADLKPYAEYKESGLPWLGRVPRHWIALAIRRFSRVFAGATPSRAIPAYWQNGSIPWLASGDVNLRRIRHARQFITDKGFANSSTKWIRPGSLVVALAGQGRTKGMVATVEFQATCNQSLAVIEPDYRVADYRFVAYWLESRYLDLRALVGDGLRDGLNLEHVRSTYTPLPPPDEQVAIVRFLDWANGRLERAIRAKRKVIALLGEQKQAIIHRAVTRGLDPSVPLKPSGIPWLGDIPQHWEVTRIKNEFLCLNTKRVPLDSVERGAMTLRKYDYYGASGVIDKVDDYLFDDELLLIAEDGANLVLRNLPLAIIARGKFWVNNHAHILKPRRGSIEYLAHVVETLNFRPWISGAAQPKLTQDRLMSISIAAAPPEEQLAIIEHTAEQTRPIATTISRLEREIELLREYRTRLVADVVTGKLDVREVAARLPDEAPLDTDDDLTDEAETADEEATV